MKLSVIIPTYNRAGTIERAVRSVLSQTVSDLEVLVCDDGSTDDTRRVVEAIGDARVRWVAGRVGRRPAVPRNEGLKVAVGEWVAFLDSDDEWMPSKTERALAEAESHGWKAVFSNAIKHLPGVGLSGPYLSGVPSPLSLVAMLEENRVITSTMMVRREVLSGTGGFPESDGVIAAEDYALWLRVACLGPIGYISDELAVYYDSEADSVRARNAMDEFEKRKNVLKNFLEWTLRTGRSEAAVAYQELERTIVEQRMPMLQRDLADARRELARLKSSHSYRLGHALMAPARWLLGLKRH